MTDLYSQLVNSAPGRLVAGRVGLPTPPRLRRYEPGQPALAGPVLLGGAASGRLLEPLRRLLPPMGLEVHERAEEPAPESTYAGLVFDATGLPSVQDLHALWSFFHPVARRLLGCSRIVVLGTPPDDCPAPEAAIAQRALEGFTRSLAKEIKGGTTTQLVYVSPGAEGNLESTLRFLLSARSAYVDAQVIRVGPGRADAPADWERPLAGKVAVVTGASRGIGEAIATTLARDGAHVVCLDVPAQGQPLAAVANRIGGAALQLDITGGDTPQLLADYLAARHDGVDVVVHNAGVTRDKTLARMSAEQWDLVLDINLASQLRLNEALLEQKLLRPGGRIIGVSSISGIAGNQGQTNYATSKAGVIGAVQSYAPLLRNREVTINAVAPGFIETQMTAAVPLVVREAGRRMNAMAQGGLPIDVAETIAWFASPGSGGVTGNVVRVCGQSLLGA